MNLKSKIIINKAIHETRIAIIEDSKLVEIWVERPENERMVGDIYKGRVKAVIPGIQAAFVDIGMEKSAFLHVSDVSGQSIDFAAQYEIDEDEDEPETEEEEEEESEDAPAEKKGPFRRGDRGRGGRGRQRKTPPIESILKKEQEIIVQITKEPISMKGARVTSEISLPGRFLVLVPGGNKIGISRKIESRSERKRLKDLTEKYRPKGFGLIIRTVAVGKGEEEIKNEVRESLAAHTDLMKKADALPSPSLLHKEMGMTSGIIRDLLSDDVETVMVDTKEHFDEIRAYLDNTSPNLKDKVVLYEGKEPVFDNFGIEKDIESIFTRKTWLKSGGFLIFDHTEALTVIDVNSGKFLGKNNQEETNYDTNMEAAVEIARQLRMRDIGGIIVIDFIDMYENRHKRGVEDTFANALKNDRSSVSISQISDFGLMEMTRARVRPSLIHTFAEPCPTCNGIGMVQGRETTVSKIERWLKRAQAFGKEKEYTIFVHPAVYAYLVENGDERLTLLRSSTDLDIELVVDAKIGIDEFYCFSSKRNTDITKEFLVGAGTIQTPKKTRAPEPVKSYSRPVENGDGETKFGRKPKPFKKRK
jgi:ribonuclease G